MTIDVVHERLVAFTEAYPVATATPFALRLTSLVRRRGLPVEGTETLWESFRREIRPHSGNMSIDALGRLRDAVWFRGAPLDARVPLHRYLGDLAGRYVELGGISARLCEDRPMAETAAHYRWLSLALPDRKSVV